MLYRKELCNFDDPVEAALCLKIVGETLVPGPPHKITISDKTDEGRIQILQLIKAGYQILSIKD